jgi:hypothetical protein
MPPATPSRRSPMIPFFMIKTPERESDACPCRVRTLQSDTEF